MLLNSNFVQAVYPLVMIIIAAATLFVNIYVTKKSNKRFKEKEFKLKADKTYVDKEIRRIEKVADLKIESLSNIQKANHQENKNLLKLIHERVEFLYQKSMS